MAIDVRCQSIPQSKHNNPSISTGYATVIRPGNALGLFLPGWVYDGCTRTWMALIRGDQAGRSSQSQSSKARPCMKWPRERFLMVRFGFITVLKGYFTVQYLWWKRGSFLDPDNRDKCAAVIGQMVIRCTSIALFLRPNPRSKLQGLYLTVPYLRYLWTFVYDSRRRSKSSRKKEFMLFKKNILWWSIYE